MDKYNSVPFKRVQLNRVVLHVHHWTYSCISQLRKGVNNDTRDYIETNGCDYDEKGNIIEETISCSFCWGITLNADFLKKPKI